MRVAFDFGPAFSAGIAFEAAKGENELFNGGGYEREAYGGSAYLAYAPDLGFQFVASTTAGSLDLDITRGYFSDNTPVVSRGDSDSTAYGAGARIGGRFAPNDNIRLTPFASYTTSRVAIDGWTESDGPFPAEFGDLDQTAQITRVGAEGRLIYMPGNWLWGSAAWGHRLGGDGATVDGELLGLFGLTIPGAALDDNWLELAPGIRQAVGSGGVLTASITTTASVDDMPQATGASASARGSERRRLGVAATARAHPIRRGGAVGARPTGEAFDWPTNWPAGPKDSPPPC